MPPAPLRGECFNALTPRFFQLPALTRMLIALISAAQDDTYTESYISTIGVDFVSRSPLTICGMREV